ncbi:hypothetical protein [Corynebacterium pseudodiphtheriticum]|uniref:hypothetical protein n=1 Tax=Corynebacterium pseudodiphtheriticum TaxID=37637 RepID=UPI0020BE2D95|nr:hypothetical protein [Corynebacterium pseudodiphtheriticum]UQV54204.1 hypothetical protein L2D23_00265 [Corynebacterium pseudodiphtheriticum]
MAVAMQEQKVMISPDYVEHCAAVIEKSGAHKMIDFYFRQDRGMGGRKSTGPRYSMLGVLTIGLALIGIRRVPSMAEIWRTLCTLDPAQQVRLELDLSCGEGTYRAFAMWLTRRLEPLDSLSDAPARRVKNGDHRRMMAARPIEQEEASEVAFERLHQVINSLVAGSVHEQAPKGYRGDIIADETFIDLAGQSMGLGSRDNKRRGAAYSGAYYIRDREDHALHSELGNHRSTKGGVAVGITAVCRVGPPRAVYSVAPVITGISIDKPSSGSVQGLARAIRFHQENGFDQRVQRGRLPLLTVDMGYNVKRLFNDELLAAGYAPVVRYPKNWRTVFASDTVVGDEPASGPLQIAGEFYCPAARDIAGNGKIVRRTMELLAEDDGFERQDARLEALFPLIMGTNSRPYRARQGRGRPRKDENESEKPVKIDLVCPAVQGRVRCPLKPASMTLASEDAPEISPSWTADHYKCCAKSSTTHTFTPEQWKRAQWGLVPGSWEHATYYEAARAITEQRFSIMKSPHVTGMEAFKRGVRREPMLYITRALWVASTNLAIQEQFERKTAGQDSMTRRLRMVREDTGRDLAKVPPRT